MTPAEAACLIKQGRRMLQASSGKNPSRMNLKRIIGEILLDGFALPMALSGPQSKYQRFSRQCSEAWMRGYIADILNEKVNLGNQEERD
jgi:hypothetical protein